MSSPDAPLETSSPPPAPSRSPLVALCAVAVLAAVAMAVLWSNSRGDADRVSSERDALIEERDLATDVNVALNTKLQVAQAQLETAQDELADAVEAADPSAIGDRVADLEAEVERLTTDNEALATDLANAQTTASSSDHAPAPSTAPVTTDPATTVPATTVPATTVPATTVPAGAAPGDAPEPLTPAQAGRQLAGLYRNDVMGPGQELCLGEVVINDLGADRLAILLRGPDPGANDALRSSMEGAAAFCAIDPSAIFGS